MDGCVTLSPGQAEVALRALAQHLDAAGALPVDLVVCGGTAMNVLGYVERATRDVDVLRGALNALGAPDAATGIR